MRILNGLPSGEVCAVQGQNGLSTLLVWNGGVCTAAPAVHA